MKCPITGSELIKVEQNRWPRIMDGPCYWRSVDNPELLWMSNPRRLGFLTLINSVSSKSGTRFFELDSNQNWVELFPVEGYDLLFPANTSKDEIQLEKNRIDREREEIAAVKAMFPKPAKIEAKTVDTSDPQPLKPPSNELFWVPYIIEEPEVDKIDHETSAHALKTRFPSSKFSLND